MSIFSGYVLFALTTAIVAIYELLHPVVVRRINNNKTVNDKIIIYITFFILAMLTAPVILISCLMPSAGEKFREVLYRELFEE